MNGVLSGQLWSLMDANCPRYTLRVTHIECASVFGTLAGGKEVVVALSVLAMGRRGARLVERSDGTPVELPKYDAGVPLRTYEDTRTASDYVKTKGPKGVARASEQAKEALRLKESGTSFADLAVRYGVTPGTMSGWLSRAREAREDERNLRRTG